MRAKRFHGLKRIKVRQSWNKHNLYNLSRLKKPFFLPFTHYQQKWSAKSLTRSYHGEQIKEKQWERMFTSKVRSVVPMNHKYLAAYDGSEQAAGRGSGRDLLPSELDYWHATRARRQVPYMHMTYAPAERRLDTAIFRALFASSARQARQFVIHGQVKVNGKKMIYPGYLLNPGDMFQVDPDRVMFATGAPKNSQERRATRVFRKGQNIKKSSEEALETEDETAQGTAVETPTTPIAEDGGVDTEEAVAAKRKTHKASLKDLLQIASAILGSKNDAPSAKRKQEIRAFTSTVRHALSSVNRTDVTDLDTELDTLVSQLAISSPAPSSESSSAQISQSAASDAAPLTEDERVLLRDAMREARENPIDPSKPYATPWRPRPYMSPFVFIPRYLEVNQNICAAVYLRHPVARPGLAEVPTPFAAETSQLAFTWYLRRR
ncbi:MAG: mitochondrial 37S ribosomal protein nam9 [Claussenomyces sp. TS43310]|nr:MAG: mitochondrial 37S ribosomal protein nam9 [Claussenomyces sp. TS43310]